MGAWGGVVGGEAELYVQGVSNVGMQSLVRIWLVAFVAACLFMKPQRAIGGKRPPGG